MGETAETAKGPCWRWLVWLFAALGLATALAIIWLTIYLSGAYPRERATVAADHAPGETLEVGNVSLLAGTGLIAIEIRTVGDGLKGSSYSRDNGRNLLLLDRVTGSSRRVLPDNTTRIVDIAYFPAAAQGARSELNEAVAIADESREPPPAYYLLTLQRHLPNGDHVFDLLAGALATGKQAIVMRGLSGVDQSGMLDASRLGLVVREDEALYYRVIDIPALKQVESHKIEIG